MIFQLHTMQTDGLLHSFNDGNAYIGRWSVKKQQGYCEQFQDLSNNLPNNIVNNW